jgi:hypothetical protein
MSQWQNPPLPGFSVDPATAPTLRPSTSDRDYADTTLRLAHAEGRLTDAELAERVERANSAWSLRELSEVIADVSVPTAPGANLTMMPVAAMPPLVSDLDPVRRTAQLVLTRSVVSWLALAVMFNLIWLFTGGAGHYYWPIWPMFGTAVPLIGLVAARFGPQPKPLRRPEPPRDLR